MINMNQMRPNAEFGFIVYLILFVGCAYPVYNQPNPVKVQNIPEFRILPTGEKVYSVAHVLANSEYYVGKSILLEGFVQLKNPKSILITDIPDIMGIVFNIETDGLITINLGLELAGLMEVSHLSHIPALQNGKKYRFNLLIAEGGKNHIIGRIIKKPQPIKM